MRLRPQPDDSDGELLALVRRGCTEALDVLFHRHRDVAYRVAYRLLGREADALDAVQEGFLNALTHVKDFRQHCTFRTWLLRIVSNASLDLGRARSRREKRLAPAEPAEFESNFVLDDELDHSELRERLHAALAALPAPQRQTFVLHVDGGLSYHDVAEALDLPIGTVMSRLFYARKRLKLLLASHATP